jgi:hypothetical protein
MTAPIADAPDDQRLTVRFPRHDVLQYRVSRALAPQITSDLRACCTDALVVLDNGPVEALGRTPSESLWRWT